MRIAFDASSVIWTALQAGIDKEGYKVEHNGRRVHVNKSAHGYENAVNHIIGTLLNWQITPCNAIFVFEGRGSKAPRLAIDSGYKAKRGSRPQESYLEFEECKALIKAAFAPLGAVYLTQDEAEGDDTLGYLAKHSEEDLVIDSYDNDISVLNGVNAHGANITVSIGGIVGENKYGSFPTKYIHLYKALVGDVGDSITGIKGFGAGAWNDFYAEFGDKGCAELCRLADLGSLDELVPEMDLNAMVARLVKGEKEFLLSYKLAKIYPEFVNTYENPLVFQANLIRGPVTDERLMVWKNFTKLVTASNWEQFVEWSYDKLLASDFIALDIETSTPEESDTWLVAQGKAEGAGVDVIGSELTGMSLTFGPNKNLTVYITVDHADSDNVDKSLLQGFIRKLSDAGKVFVIQNVSFEHTVLFNEWGADWKDNGAEGLLPNCLDTKIEASYVNENESLGLKKLSKLYFDYDQVDYVTVTTIEGVQYKMRELSASHVKDYGCDDTIVTASIHNFFKLFMQLEHTWKVYLDVEIDAMYLHSQSFIHGTKCSVAKLKELEALDDVTYDTASTRLFSYLVTKGWDGCLPPAFGTVEGPTVAQIKEIFQIVEGKELVTRDRKIEKLVGAMKDQGSKLLAEAIEGKDWESVNKLIAMHFKAKPTFNAGSPKQMQVLLYETMALPVRVYNKPTPIARKAGIKQGSPKTDTLAITYALVMDADEEQKEVLTALKLMKMVETRRGLYYSTYPYFVHWKTGRIHSSHNQCATNTRRASSSAPNLQQMPKHSKIEGYAARFREVLVPHKKNAVIVSMDFAAQELRVIADYSNDANMVACFVGDSPKDMHALTGLGIAIRKEPAIEWSYELFADILHDDASPMYKFVKECRTLGKKVNFTTEYGAMAPKLAQTMLVSESDAQDYIDAKEATFPEASAWKLTVIAEAKANGFVTTKLGARRHLRDALVSSDRYEASKAERQSVNFKIQGSSAEMTKLAEGRIWKERLEQRFDCEVIAPVHDEIAISCAIDDLYECLPVMHRCMVEQYADMVIPICSSISMGADFGQQIEIGETPSKEAIDAGLAKYYELAGKAAPVASAMLTV